jgi:hypothetical protein
MRFTNYFEGETDMASTLEPVTRIEQFLADIIDQGGGGGGSGGGGNVLVVNDVNDTLDKTWQELWDALNVNPCAYVVRKEIQETFGSIQLSQITAINFNPPDPEYPDDKPFGVSIGTSVYYADTASDYPRLQL